MFILNIKSKQKRNSCMAIMNDFNSSVASSQSHAATAADKTVPISINNASLRDSVNSFQSYLPSSPVERLPRAANKNFRKMANISSMFNGTNKNKVRIQFKFQIGVLIKHLSILKYPIFLIKLYFKL